MLDASTMLMQVRISLLFRTSNFLIKEGEGLCDFFAFSGFDFPFADEWGSVPTVLGSTCCSEFCFR